MRTFLRGAVATLALTVGSQALAGPLVNGDFETGDLTGWTISIDGGSASVALDNATDYSPGDWFTEHTFTPYEGSYMLVLGSGEADIWQTASQTIDLAAGQTLSGRAFFDWGDYWIFGDEYPDGASVRIFDGSTLLATPWERDGTDFCLSFCDPETDQAGAESGWESWSFTAGAAGAYTVVLGARNTGDSGGPNPTYGYFDALTVTSVPEPTTLGLLGLALLGLGGQRRRARVTQVS